jgi:hypothetical protein
MRPLILITVTLALLAAGCGDDSNTNTNNTNNNASNNASNNLSTNNSSTDMGNENPDTGNNETPDTGNNETPDTGNNETPDTGNNETPDTGNNETPDVGTGEFVGCTGASGSCDGLTGQACQAGAQLGCTGSLSIGSCQRKIACIPGIDGCPFDYCVTVAGNCQFKDPAQRDQQLACSSHTTYDACVAGDCIPADITPVCSGTWSCDVSFAEIPAEERPPSTSCESFQPLGFACTPVFQ